jgi:hypothetical protein
MTVLAAIGSVGCCIATLVTAGVALHVFHVSRQPDVMAYLETERDHGVVLLVVRNFGAGAARDISIEGFDDSLVDPSFSPMISPSFIGNGIPYLVPDGSRDTIVAKISWAEDHLSGKKSNVVVYWTRRGLLGRSIPCSSKCFLDYYSFANSLYTKSDVQTIAEATEDIAKSLANMH